MPTAVKNDELLICIESFVDGSVEGTSYRKNVTLVRADDPIFKANPTWRKFFAPAESTRERIEYATAHPGEVKL